VYELTINESKVVPVRRRTISGGHRFTNKRDFMDRLGEGLSTHDEIRQVLDAATGEKSPLRDPARDFFRHTAKALIVDEVFDGNIVDLRIVAIAAAAGVPTTVIGDPWQALYAFRGGRPDLVPRLVTALSFVTYPIDQSFRFAPDMEQFARSLRAGDATTLPIGTPADADVVLASRWETLWGGAPSVLPLSFGAVGNRVDAALSVLLDHVVRAHFGEPSVFGADATAILGLETDTLRTDAPPLFTRVLERLAPGSSEDAAAALQLLRESLVALGSSAITRLQPPKEAERVRRVQALAARLKADRLVPGLTIHQAKGREWDRVGVAMTNSELSRVGAGLEQAEATDRALYVALTRARRLTFRT
jgi:DNA helicase-2/ATP-dependent DNA helicase PcrA